MRNTSGKRNVSIGSLAMDFNTLGDDNVAIGTLALHGNQSGTGNTVVGYFAKKTNTIGTNNTILGNAADVTLNNLTNATAIGYNAKVASSNALILGDAATVRVGIGTSNPNLDSKLEVIGNIYCSNKIYIGVPDATTLTKINSYALAVNGDAIANRIRVKSYANWPDYVFNENYHLLSLEQLEAFIQKEKHLPNVTSASTIQKEGLDIATSQKELLEKIEELTLYLIEQNKILNQQSEKIKSLESYINNK